MPSVPNDSPNDLMRRVQAGDVIAFEQIVHRYRNMVHGLAMSIVGSPEDAEEAAQDAFLKLYRARERFDVDRGLEPWLLRIAGNSSRDVLRRRKAARAVRGTEDPDLLTLVADRRDLEGRERRELAGAVQLELGRLSDSLREPLVLKYLNGMTNPQIAAALGISLSNVKVRVARAKDLLQTRMRRALGEEEHQ